MKDWQCVVVKLFAYNKICKQRSLIAGIEATLMYKCKIVELVDQKIDFNVENKHKIDFNY